MIHAPIMKAGAILIWLFQPIVKIRGDIYQKIITWGLVTKQWKITLWQVQYVFKVKKKYYLKELVESSGINMFGWKFLSFVRF